MLWRAWSRRGVRACAAMALAAASLAAWFATSTPGGARASGARLLPNLLGAAPVEPEIQAESVNGHERLLLRFTGYIHNAGKGALDMKGSREAPKLSPQGQAELKVWETTHSNMSASLEHELANPPMEVTQQLFTTNVGEEETNIERPHEEVPAENAKHEPAVMVYSNADGHNHWHLQHVAKYSLWNEAKTSEAAPSQKVGFCLLDSIPVKSDGFGPSKAVYEDAVRGEFCERYKPWSTHLREGISRGWEDKYEKTLAFQWVDASEVAPGEYWLREDVNPEGTIKEEGTGKKFEYAAEPTVIPGYTALAQSVEAKGTPLRIKLEAHKWEGHKEHEKPSSEIQYKLVSGPAHGTLEQVAGNEVIYKPTGGYTGPDSFSFSAHDGKSKFPLTAQSATVSITDHVPSLAISGAQPQQIEGTGVTLTASASFDNGPIEWSTSAGTLSAKEGAGVVFTAPHARESVTVTARLQDDPEVSAHTTIEVIAAPPAEPAPEPPPQNPGTSSGGQTQTTQTGSTGGSSGVLGTGSSAPVPKLQRPRVMLVNRELVMNTSSTVPGRLRLSAYLGSHRLGSCVGLTPGSRVFTCRLHLPRSISTHARISIVASMRIGALVLKSVLSARQIPEMRMVPVGKGAHGASAGAAVYWCSPSTLHEVLEGGSE